MRRILAGFAVAAAVATGFVVGTPPAQAADPACTTGVCVVIEGYGWCGSQEAVGTVCAHR